VHPEIIRVVAAVIVRADRVLVCQRPRDKRHGGLWEFPGGKCEPGESDAAAATRELFEELGVDVVSVDDPEYDIHDADSPFHISFVPVKIRGEPRCIEHTALDWATAETLATLALAPSDRRYADFRRARGERTP
jgi:mutator protein MutT